MFITKKPFKNLGIVFTAGTVVDNPAVIKRFKSKVAEGKIVEVTEHNFDLYRQYFMDKFGVDITPKEEPRKSSVKPTVKVAKVVSK